MKHRNLAKSWIIFLFIVAFVVVTSSSGFTLDRQELLGTSNVISNQVDNCHLDREVRGVWLTNIDSDVLFSTEKTSNAIATLAELNFNTLYPTVWNWGYTLYPSAVAKQVTGRELDPTEGLHRRDVLQEIIAQGHQKGMAVIPWFEFGFMAPADSELAKLHPEWLTQRADGSTMWLEGKMHERVWLNPLHPEVQKFITDLIVEIISNYDVEGIQLDDHFGYPSELGYDDYTVTLYQQEHNGKSPPPNSQDLAWIQWRADKITNYMEELFQVIKKTNPQAIVSVSPQPKEISLKSNLLDWPTWESQGLIEELIVQIYRNNTNSFVNEITQPDLIAAKEHIPVSIGILSGLKGRPVLFDTIRQQVAITRAGNFAGMSFFFYESLWNMTSESPEPRKDGLRALFKNPVARVDGSMSTVIGTNTKLCSSI